MSVIVQEVDLKSDGKWVECRLTECNLMFYKRSVGHKYFSTSDKIDVCPLCTHKKKIINGTIQKMRDIIVDYHHKNVDSKPGTDTL